MAGEVPGGSPTSFAIFVFGGFALLVLIWYMTGGPSRADLRGIFLSPPAPLGTGDAYGPQIGTSSDSQY